MSGENIFNNAPLGSIISWSDNTPRPPDRHKKKLALWKNNNGQGRLINKKRSRNIGHYNSNPSMTFHEKDITSGSTIIMKTFRTFNIDSDLTFKIIEYPSNQDILILNEPGSEAELLHIAKNQVEAENWLSRNHYDDAVFRKFNTNEIAETI